MALPSSCSVYNMKRRKNNSTIIRKSSVSIIKLQNGRRRTKTYQVENAVRTVPNATTNPPILEESPQNDEMDVEESTENVVVTTAQSRKTKACTPYIAFPKQADQIYSLKTICSMNGCEKKTSTWPQCSILKILAQYSLVGAVTDLTSSYSAARHA